MKKYCLAIILIVSALNIAGQKGSDLGKLAETEKSFAQTADEKGIKAAFIEFLADDGVIFRLTAINGKEFWRAQPESPAHLSWYPVFVDASSNGAFGYTTGAGEYRPKGKSDSTVYYNEYLTLWRRQPNGDYKAAFDIGISHDKPASEDKNWKFPDDASGNPSENISPASAATNLFFDTATLKGLNKAYQVFASENIRFLREGKQPILGKINALAEYKKDKRAVSFGRYMTLQSAGDLAYTLTTYELKEGIKSVEKGNTVQIWKFSGGKWQIVADVFSPIADKK